MIVFVLVQVTFWAEPWTTWTGFCRCPTDAGSRTWRSSPPTSTSCSTWQTHSSWPKPSRTRPPTSWPAVSLRWLHVERVTNVPSLVLVLPVKWPLVVTFVCRCLFSLSLSSYTHELIMDWCVLAGYQRQLNYKHEDGAYSTFGSGPGNTWSEQSEQSDQSDCLNFINFILRS